MWFGALTAGEEADLGTLIVTYQSDAPKERLDRVRFWLINEKGERRLYPRGNNYVEDSSNGSRLILIESLPVGSYHVTFAIPNCDGAFKPILPRKVDVVTHKVVKINQPLAMAVDTVHRSDPHKSSNAILTNAEEPTPLTHEKEKASLTVKSNLDSSSWALLNSNHHEVANGNGKESSTYVPAGKGYMLKTEAPAHFAVTSSQNSPFSLDVGQLLTITLNYKKQQGHLEISTPMPNGEIVKVQLLEEGEHHRKVEATAVSRQGMLRWRSTPLDPGRYILAVTPPAYYAPVDPMKVTITHNDVTTVHPHFEGANSVHVITNTDKARYILKQRDSQHTWEGEGESYTFQGLLPGFYTLTFTSAAPDNFFPPEPERLLLSRSKNASVDVQANFEPVGKVIIESNVATFAFRVHEFGGTQRTFKQEGNDQHAELHLPEGKYRITFSPPSSQNKKATPAPIDFEVTACGKQTLYVDFPDLALPISSLDTDKERVATSSDYTMPEGIPLATVEAGPAIFGDPFKDNHSNELPARTIDISTFAIGRYLVTNKQYADWLNAQYHDGQITFSDGLVKTSDGHLLMKTIEADSNSQISGSTIHAPIFRPIPSKDAYPVIFVTWYGADSFNRSHHYRLPTEAEWEKAAGMALPQKDKKPTKYRYSFSHNTIDRRWANYKEARRPTTHSQVLTTPVGYYNGKTMLPLTADESDHLMTEDAVSPVGAYDMSGNVWEWVNDWYSPASKIKVAEKDPTGPATGNDKIAKGGCYNSPAAGVRVAERIALAPDHCDAYTGFRIATTPQEE